MRTIDLSGNDRNAFSLMAYAKSTAKQLGSDPSPIIEQMMAGDYNHLIKVFEENFGTIYKLKNKPKS